MKTEQKCKLADLKKLNLKGLEIVAVTETSSDDISSITIRDTVTGTELRVGRNAYSEFSIHAEKPPVIEKRFFVRGKAEGDAPIEVKFNTKAEAESFIAKNLLFEDLQITEVEEKQ